MSLSTPISELTRNEELFFDLIHIHAINAARDLSSAHHNIKKIKNDRGHESAVFPLFSACNNFHVFMTSAVMQTIENAPPHRQMEPFVKELSDRVFSASGFSNQWRAAFNACGAPSYYFDEYEKLIFNGVIVHSSGMLTHKDIKDFNTLSFEDVYRGIRSGWHAAQLLVDFVYESDAPEVLTWEHLCEQGNLPPDLFPDET